jgi:trimeric autotransporter adhesin
MRARARGLFAGMLPVVVVMAAIAAGAPLARAAGSPGIISTVAGGPGRGLVHNVAQEANWVATAPDGSVYESDVQGVVRQFSDTSTWEKAIAGVGVVTGYGGDGGLATRARLGLLGGVALDQDQNVLIADISNNRIRMIAATSGTFYGVAMTAGDMYTVAGNGTGGFAGDGGPAGAARLSGPQAVAVDGAGNLVISDTGNQRIRVVAATSGTFYGQAMTAGDIYTVAGNGRFEFSGDGGPATAAGLRDPMGVTVDPSGNLVIADNFDSRVRVVAATSGTFYAVAMTAGDIYTVAGNGTAAFAGDGGPATAAELYFPNATAVDGAGNLVIADYYNNQVRVIAATSGSFYGQAMTAGDIYTVAGTGSPTFSGDGGPATAASVPFPSSVAVDRSGNLVISEPYSDRVRVAAVKSGKFYNQAMTAGDIYTVAGNGLVFESGNTGKAVDAELATPTDIAVDGTGSGAGNYALLDYAQVRLVAASSGTFFGQAMSPGRIYGIAGNGRPGYTGDGGPATAARVGLPPGGVAFDGSGNLLLADSGNNRVRVIAAGSGTFYGQPMTLADIYTVAGDGTAGSGGDGGPAAAAELNGPEAVTVDGAGNLVISDTGNQRIRVVAATSGTFYGQAMTGGHIYTVAGTGSPGYSGDGGPATAAALRTPTSVTADTAGNLLIADSANNRVRAVAATSGSFYGQAMTAGDIYTVAGNGTYGFAGDGGPAASAELRGPLGVSVDGDGNLLISDTGNERVRLVAAASGSYFGQAVTAGDIVTVAGNGREGFLGDSGPATGARMNYPAATAVDGSGNLLIVDDDNGRVRKVTGLAAGRRNS